MAVAAWSGIAYRPTDDPFWAFLSPAAQKPVQPPKNICLVQAAEKKYILGIHPKKIINPAPFHSKAFVLLYKFEMSWALLSRLSRFFFFSISGASNFSNFKHFKQLFMLANYVSRRVSCFVSTIGDKMSWDTSPKSRLFYGLWTSKGGNIAFLPHPLRTMLGPCSSYL